MANKINVKLILELRDAGMSRNTIASTRHISRNSVSDVIHIADEKGIRFKDVRLSGLIQRTGGIKSEYERYGTLFRTGLISAKYAMYKSIDTLEQFEKPK